MLISGFANPLAELINTIRDNLKNLDIDVNNLIKLHEIFSSSKSGPKEAEVLKSIFEVIVHIYESGVDIAGDHDVQCHILIGECYEHLLNVLKKNTAIHKDLCLKAVDVLIAVTKKHSQSLNIVFKFVSNALLDIVTCIQLSLLDRKEFLRAFNFLLENTERKIRYSTRDELKLEKLSKLLYTCGDYETQANLIETIFRYTSMEDRKILARRWLNEGNDIITSFLSIKDFEPDCRKFLIKFNNVLKENTLVFSMPCLKAVVGKCELEKPEDPNYEEFWIDFNLGSRSVSVVCSQESLYSKSIYGSQITTGFWETLSIESQSVSKVSLQSTTPFPIPDGIKEDAFEVSMILVQPCHIIFSYPSNFEGNMVVITFSMRFMKKIQMLIEMLFPENHSFNLKPKKEVKKSSVAVWSEVSLGSSTSKLSTENLNDHRINIETTRPYAADNSEVQPCKECVESGFPQDKRQKDFQSNEKTFHQLLKSRSKSPFKPLEIVISPSGNRQGQSGTCSTRKSLPRTPEADSCIETEVGENTPYRSADSKDTGICTLNTPLLHSATSNEQREEDRSKVYPKDNQCSRQSYSNTAGPKGNKSGNADNKTQIPMITDKTKSESKFSPDLKNKRVLRSRKRLLANVNTNSVTTQVSTVNPVLRENQSNEKNVSTSKRSQKGNLAKAEENKQKVNEEKIPSSHSKPTLSQHSNSSDTDSFPSWITFGRSGPKNKLTLSTNETNDKLHTNNDFKGKRSIKYQERKNTEGCSNIPEENSLKGAAELKEESAKKTLVQKRGQNKRLPTKKKLFNISDNTLIVPLEENLKTKETSGCAPRQGNKPKQINAKSRRTIDPNMPIIGNWVSGTESEISWLNEYAAKKLSMDKIPRYSYQRNRNSGRLLGEKLNQTVRNQLDYPNDKDIMTKKKDRGSYLKAKQALRCIYDDVSGSSEDEDFQQRRRPKKVGQKSDNAKKGTNNMEEKKQDKRNDNATKKTVRELEKFHLQQDLVVEKNNSYINGNMKSNDVNGLQKTVSEKKAINAPECHSNTKSKALITENETFFTWETPESDEINVSSNSAKNNSLVLDKNQIPNPNEEWQPTMEVHESPSNNEKMAHKLLNSNNLTETITEQTSILDSVGSQKRPIKQVGNEIMPDNFLPVKMILTENILNTDHHHSVEKQVEGQNSTKKQELGSNSKKELNSKHVQDEISARELKSFPESIPQARAKKINLEMGDSNISPNLEKISHSSESRMISSDDEEENCIPPSLVESNNVTFPTFMKSLPGKFSIFNSKNVTTKRGSYFTSKVHEENKIINQSSVKNSPEAKNLLGNNDYFSSNPRMVKSQGHKRRHQDEDINKNRKESSLNTTRIPEKRFKRMQEKLHNFLAENETQRETMEQPIFESQEETELDKLISEFNSTSSKEKADQDIECKQARNKFTINNLECDEMIHFDPKENVVKHSARKVRVTDLSGFKKKPFTSCDAPKELSNNRKKTQPHLLKDSIKEINSPGYDMNPPEDHFMDFGKTIKNLFQRRNTIKAQSFHDLRHQLLNLTAEAATEFQAELIRSFREDQNYCHISDQMKVLDQCMEMEKDLVKRFDKCYRYLSNTSIMKFKNNQRINESLEKIRKFSEENAIKDSKSIEINIDDRYNSFIKSKVSLLKEKFIQQEQKKEMMKTMQYVKSLIMK